MPFDASGNFTRSYNFQQDRDNGLKITASRVDGEFDNFATSMNLVFFRDGRVPMQADLRLNTNGIQGLKDGALGAPAIKFNSDAGTGVYLPGLSQYGIQVNSVQRGVFNSSGLIVTGTITSTGSIIESGAQLDTKYSRLASPVFTGNPTAPTPATADNTASIATTQYVKSNLVSYAPLATPIFTGTPATPTATTGNNSSQIASTAFVQNTVAGYVPIAGGTMTGSLTVPNILVGGNAAVNPAIVVNGASGTARSYNFQTAGASAGAIALQTDNSTIQYNAPGGAHQFVVAGTERFKVTSSGATLTGTLSCGDVVASRGDGTGIIYFGVGGGNNYIYWDGAQYNHGASGPIRANNSYMLANGADATRNAGFMHNRAGQVGYNMYNNGGVAEWLMYQPAAGVGHEFRIATFLSGVTTDRFKIDATGNITVPGTLAVTGAMTASSTVTATGNVRTNGEFLCYSATNPGTGVLRFGPTDGSRYLYYDGAQFNFSAALVVAGNITSTSDARLKSDVRDFANGLAVAKALKPKRFNMYGKPDFGFIAQDVQPVLPEVVSRDGRGFLSIDYGRLTAVLTAAVHTLDERLSAVEQKLGL